MALTTTQPTMPASLHNTSPNHVPQPTPSQLLQRHIEDTLMLISALPETTGEKVIRELGTSDGAGGGWFEIQCNQLALFMQLEELVEELEPGAKEKLFESLHPAMSLQERNALKLVLVRGLRRNMIPRPLEVRKVGSSERGDGGREREGKRKLYTIPPRLQVEELVSPSARMDELVFPELSVEEMALRETELVVAKEEQSGEMDLVSSKASTATTDSSRRRQETADMFSVAAKRLQVTEGSSGLVSPVVSPTLKEGLHLIKAATSALRAYTDVSPREVVVRSKQKEILRSDEASPRPSKQLFRPGEEMSRPSDQMSRSTDHEPPAIELPIAQGEYLMQWRLTSASPTAKQETAPGSMLAPDDPSPRPQSDPSNMQSSRATGCPWPESFFTSPRTPPPAPRSLSLPQPPPPPPPPPVPKSPPRSPTYPTSFTNPTDSPRHVLPSPTSSQSPNSATAHSTPRTTAGERRQGSISAARAGIANRIQREQMDAVRSNLPCAKASVGGKWTWRSAEPGTGSGRASVRASGATAGWFGVDSET